MEDTEDEEGDVEMADGGQKIKFTLSKRKKKADETSNAGSVSTESTESSPVDDRLPQPRVSGLLDMILCPRLWLWPH